MAVTRVQLALNVDDLATATEFYSKLFGAQPHKQRAGYANFALEDPPLKLVLIENPRAGERLNHLGVEAATAEEVSAALARFQAAGLTTRVAFQHLCCHAVQDKVFVSAPEVPHGWWEYYHVTDDDPAADQATSSACCGTDEPASAACCG